MDFAFPTQFVLAGCVAIAFAAVVICVKVPFRYNLRHLLVRWRTTLLTTLAFTVVVGVQTVMLAFVKSMQQIVARSGQPWNVMVLSDGATDEIYSNLDYPGVRNVELNPLVLKDRQGVSLASWEVYVVINQPMVSAEGKRNRRFISFRGLEDAERAAAVHGLELLPGGAWFSATGVQSVAASPGEASAIQAVIGEGCARELGRDRGGPLSVGDVFEAGPRRWVVVGVMKSAGTTFDSEVWANRRQVGQTFHRERHTTLTLRTADAAAARELAGDLNENYHESPVHAVVESDYYSKLNDTNRQFLGAAIVVTVILCVGGAFGTMNTMFAAVALRRREIGVLRILGFRRRQILASFFLEAVVMSTVGGVLGCALATLVDGWTTTSILSGGQGAGKSVVLRLSVDGNVLLTGMLIAVGMGTFGGLAPAVAAMRLRPSQAMR
jgi:ABC-type antimicrobial peptide transport system permease subunit